jgi:hypothetical protein
MMKKRSVLLITLIFPCFLYAQKPATPAAPVPISSFPAFQDNEELVFTLHYGIIKGGEAIVTLKKESFDNTQEVFHAVAKAHTTGLANKIFRVLDIYESYFDVRTNLPVKSIRDIREGNYKYYNEVSFNHRENTINSQRSGIHKVPANIHDMVSAFFYIRRIDFSNYKGGEIISVDTYFGDEVFPFYVVFKGRETVSIGLGKFKCLKFVPIVEPGRIFKESDDMTFWFSDDDNKIPIRIKFDLIVGSFKCDLSSSKCLKYNLLSKMSD